ncbi:MAG: DUF5985 family protein [Kofleriaceae bacterium]
MSAHQFLHGGLAVGCAAIALAFFRYYRLACDELFLWFSAAFVVFAAQWTILAFGALHEHTHIAFLIRLLGFVFIAIAIVRKNRGPQISP